ncbi:serine/threonine-protein kinase [Sorangium sp. So ce233]|uniref:serine/threonine-protein kinase n=1 Tax=Sorangium sp. So ce233 TaxID=3133290 RepID=UPI003F5FFCCF
MSLNVHERMLFAGRYRVVRGIATGAMGAVYEVIHVETERRRALKVMHPHLAENLEFHARFKLEARIAARVATEHIVEVFDAGIDPKTGMPFLVMELLRGEDLSKRLRRSGRLPPEETVAYLRQTAIALDKTHAAGIVHRDLKPANLFLAESDDDEEPRIKVLDFGIAKLVAETAGDSTTTGGVGTPLYMAPEQFVGESISGAVDIFALGMLAYTLLVGTAYWSSEKRELCSTFEFAAIAGYGPQEPACARAATEGVSLPPAFDAWFAKATACAPEARFATASAAVEALAEVFHITLVPMRSSRLSVLETPLPSVSQGVQTPAPPPDRIALAFVALAMLAAGVITFARLGDGAPPAPGGAACAQVAQTVAWSPTFTPPEAGSIPAHHEACMTPRRYDLVTCAPFASAPRADGDRSAPRADGDRSAPRADGDRSAPRADGDRALAHVEPSASVEMAAMPPRGAVRKAASCARPSASASCKSREWLYTPD